LAEPLATLTGVCAIQTLCLCLLQRLLLREQQLRLSAGKPPVAVWLRLTATITVEDRVDGIIRSHRCQRLVYSQRRTIGTASPRPD